MWLRNLSVIFSIVLLTACQTSAVNTSYNSNYENFDRYSQPIDQPASVISRNDKGDLWQVTRTNLKFNKFHIKARVKAEITSYNRYPPHMTAVSKQASPYYYYVLKEVLERGLPSEVALIPVIESLYDPNAYSYGKASGIWQIIPSTAKYLGLKINNWYDGRRDLIHSTDTALDYLERLNKRFKGDWMLTFAAYNGGGGTVSKAMRINREKGLPTDYWSLKLPKETTRYVPKILAVAALVKSPKKYKIELPSIANVPVFNIVKIKGQVDLNKAASLAKLDRSVIDQFNPGFNKGVTSPNGPFRLLVPVHNAQKLQRALSQLNPTKTAEYGAFEIKSAVSLGPVTAHKVHKINNGDTVWDIAKKHKLSVKEILAFNGLSKDSTLRIGSSIKIPTG